MQPSLVLTCITWACLKGTISLNIENSLTRQFLNCHPHNPGSPDIFSGCLQSRHDFRNNPHVIWLFHFVDIQIDGTKAIGGALVTPNCTRSHFMLHPYILIIFKKIPDAIKNTLGEAVKIKYRPLIICLLSWVMKCEVYIKHFTACQIIRLFLKKNMCVIV